MDTKEKTLTPDELFEANQGLVYSMSKRYMSVVSRDRIEDLKQEGMLALLLAAREYNPEKGVAFSTYASTSIRNAMKRYVIADQTIRIPEYRNSEVLTLVEILTRMNSSGIPVTVEAIMEMTGFSEEKVKELMEHYTRRQLLSMESVIDETGDEMGTLMTTGESAEDVVMKQSSQDLISIVREVYNDRYADVVAYYYGLNGEHSHTLDETGAKFKVTKERVRQLVGKVTGTYLTSDWDKGRFFLFKERLRDAGLS